MTIWQAVFFDLDETLIRNELPAATLFERYLTDDLAAVSGHAPAFLRALVRQAGEVWAQMGQLESVEEELVRAYQRALLEVGLDVDARRLLQHFTEVSARHTCLNSGAKELILQLRGKGIQTGVISNGFVCVQGPKVRHHGIDQWVDSVVFSEHAGVHKPDPEIFRYATQRLGVEPSQCLYVGDHPTNDIRGGRAAGMSVRLYDPSGSAELTGDRGDSDISTEEVITHFDQLRPLFDLP